MPMPYLREEDETVSGRGGRRIQFTLDVIQERVLVNTKINLRG
jgi:hypothetical protein